MKIRANMLHLILYTAMSSYVYDLVILFLLKNTFLEKPNHPVLPTSGVKHMDKGISKETTEFRFSVKKEQNIFSNFN